MISDFLDLKKSTVANLIDKVLYLLKLSNFAINKHNSSHDSYFLSRWDK